MIIIKQGEELRRRFNAKVKGFGDGTFYVTSERLCFESKKNGLCFDLDFEHLWNWEVKNSKKVKIQWQERKPGIAYSMEDKKHSIDVEFKKKDGKQPHIEDIIGSMYYAFTDKYIYGELGLGLQIDEKNQIFSRFNVGKPKVMTSEEREGLFSTIQAVQAIRLEKSTGETLLDQERFARFTMWKALDKDGEVYDKRSGVMDPKRKTMTSTEVIAGSYLSLVYVLNNIIDKCRKNIMAWEKEDNKKELEKILPEMPPRNDGKASIPMPARTEYENIKIRQVQAKIEKRVADVLSTLTFECHNQAKKYGESIHEKIVTKYLEGEDISNYTPTAEKIPSALIQAKKDIEEYRKKLTEKV